MMPVVCVISEGNIKSIHTRTSRKLEESVLPRETVVAAISDGLLKAGSIVNSVVRYDAILRGQDCGLITRGPSIRCSEVDSCALNALDE